MSMLSSTKLYPAHNSGTGGLGFSLTRLARQRQPLGLIRREWTAPPSQRGRVAARTRRPPQ